MLTKRKRIFFRIVSIALVASVLLTSNGMVVMAKNIQATEQVSSSKDLKTVAEKPLENSVILAEEEKDTETPQENQATENQESQSQCLFRKMFWIW